MKKEEGSRMKKIRIFTSFFMIFSFFIALLPGAQSVKAQDSSGATVNVDTQVLLAVAGNQAVEQGQISFDIIQTNPETGEGEVIYSYRSDNPNPVLPALAAGNYKFRLFDGGNFQRDGLELIPAKAERTIPNLTQGDIDQGNQLESLGHSGDLIAWGDGTVVWDIPFTIELGDNLLNPATGQYETQLVFTISDQQSLALVQNGATEEGESVEEETPAEVGTLNLQVVGDDGSLVNGATISINGQTYTSNEQGVIFVESLPVGQAQVEVIELPAGYTAGEGSTQTVEIAPNSTSNATLTVIKEVEVPTTNTVTISVQSDQDLPVEGVAVALNEQGLFTDANGQVTFFEVATGEQAYTVTQLPEGYSVEQASGTVTVNGETPSTLTIPLTTVETKGSVLFNAMNANSQPLAGVEIEINGAVITTAENGQASIEDLTEGGFSYSVLSVPEGYTNPEPASVNVTAGSQTEVTLTLESAVEYGNVSITVTDEASNPIIGSEIILNEKNFISNDSGQIIIEDLVAGKTYDYYVSSLPEGILMEGEAERRQVTVVANQQVDDTVVIKQAAQLGGIKFTLLDDSNQAIANAEITVGEKTVTTDAAGLAQLNDLEIGTYNYQVVGLADKYEGALEGQVTVSVNEVSEQVIQLAKVVQYGNVTFNVLDQEGNAVVGATITLNETEYPTNEAGQAIIEGVVAGQTYNYTLSSLPELYDGQAAGTVTVEANGNITEAITVQRQVAPGQLTVTILDQNDQAVVGAVVQLSPDKTATTNAEGQAIFNDLAVGTYEYSIQSIADNYTHETTAQSVHIAEGVSEAREFKVTRKIQPGSAVFTVKDQEDKVVEGAVISVNNTTVTTNAEGVATLSEIAAGTYPYSISGLPERYRGEVAGELIVTENEATTTQLTVERIIELSTAQFKVIDQNGNAVQDASISFGGLTSSTNAEGLANFQSLEPGTYNYAVESVPSGYANGNETQSTEITEGSAFTFEFKVEKLPETGSAKVEVLVNDKPTAGVEIKINDQAILTNEQGIALFEKLGVGAHTYTVSKLPEGAKLEPLTGEIKVEANKETALSLKASKEEASSSEESTSESESVEESSSESQSSSVNVEESHSLTPAEQSSIDEEASQATRQFIDAETGIEVWVNPQDAGKVEKISVEKLESSPALENADADIYKITLLDQNNNAVQLTRIAEIKIPTRPVNSQLRIVRINNSNLSNLTFALHNQRVTFRTQQLGSFAVIYNAQQASISQESSQSSVNVSIESSVEKNNLPNTGETSSKGLITMAIIALLSAAYLLLTHKKVKKEE